MYELEYRRADIGKGDRKYTELNSKFRDADASSKRFERELRTTKARLEEAEREAAEEKANVRQLLADLKARVKSSPVQALD